jgi:hypothetical protein
MPLLGYEENPHGKFLSHFGKNVLLNYKAINGGKKSIQCRLAIITTQFGFMFESSVNEMVSGCNPL